MIAVSEACNPQESNTPMKYGRFNYAKVLKKNLDLLQNNYFWIFLLTEVIAQDYSNQVLMIRWTFLIKISMSTSVSSSVPNIYSTKYEKSSYEKQTITLVFINLENAFDSVPHLATTKGF